MAFSSSDTTQRQSIAVIGSGIAGMSAAWLLSKKHDVTVYEKNDRLGGHSNTVTVETSLGATPVDTGFIVFNDATYPNLIALFEHLGVATEVSDMSFGVSLRGGKTEYSSVDTSAFLCGGRNLISPRFWSMTWDLLRFYRSAPLDLLRTRDQLISLGEYLNQRGYGEAFQRDHLLPQAAAIWSASMSDIHLYPAFAFVRFFENHGLLKLSGRPKWRTVEGGSQAYVRKLTADYAERARLNAGAVSVRRDGAGVWVRDAHGRTDRYDDVILAAHGDEALAMLEDPSTEERELLGAFKYAKNRAVLHTDPSFMPRREPLWASWNYVGDDPDGGCVVTYWMNKLQNIQSREQIFLTLNPRVEPRPETVLYQTDYDHPLFDAAAMRAQERLWSLQGVQNTWFCGAHFGSGFHEDGLQAGLAVAEQLGGVRRPWTVENESGRIYIGAQTQRSAIAA
ncbi:MAG: FAD-dependent oxidoreductase [Caulobacteraceae bacterium]|nr:FAD-dependent oxidoreductase [Caulobacteraceae bacterium]